MNTLLIEGIKRIIPKGYGIDTSIHTFSTPYDICIEMLSKIHNFKDSIYEEEDILVMFNLEFVISLIKNFNINPKNIMFISDSKQRNIIARKLGVLTRLIDIDKIRKGEFEMGKKFKVIVANPPYQTKSNNKDKKTQPIWHDFVELAFKHCKEGGFLGMIHPSGWRGIGKSVSNVASKLKSKQIVYLEMHNEKDGKKTFGAETRYDWYVLRNVDNYEKSLVKDQYGELKKIDLKNMPIIPNNMVLEVSNLIAKDNEERVNILANSAYHTQRPYVSKDETDRFRNPCVYTVNSEGKLKLYYSSVREGHFDIPKLIFSNFRISSANYYIDREGRYGLTQFAYGVVDDVNNLDKIYEAMRKKEFKDIMEACSVGQLSIDPNIFKLFRKDFWKDFI